VSVPRAFECSGEIAVGALGEETQRRLAELGGEWLDVAIEARKIVVRHVQPGGAPALAAVPAELISILDSLTAEERERVAGGTLLVRDRAGVVMRLVVERGEIRIQWPREDWTHAVPVSLDEALATVDPVSARVGGAVRFSSPAGARAKLVEFVETFEGLYPEGNLRMERDGEKVRVEFAGVNVGPAELLAKLRELAAPLASLTGELEVGSFHPNAVERDFRLRLEAGRVHAERPSLWRER